MLTTAVYHAASFSFCNSNATYANCCKTTPLTLAVHDAASFSFCNYATDAEHCYDTGLQCQGHRCHLLALPMTACTQSTPLMLAVYNATSFSLHNYNTGLQHQGCRCHLLALPLTACTPSRTLCPKHSVVLPSFATLPIQHLHDTATDAECCYDTSL